MIYLKKNKGITLVALVITIVIMLILAGITLSLTLGQNGIITKAKEVKTKSSESQIVTDIDLAYGECYIEELGDDSEITAAKLQQKLVEKGYTDATVTESDDEFTITIDEKTYKKPRNGNTQVGDNPQGHTGGNKANIKVGTTALATLTTAQIEDLIGNEVSGFNSVDGIEWKLFYVDTNNIYLITSFFAPVSALPNQLNKDTSNGYKASFDTSSDFKGNIMLNETGENYDWPNGASAGCLVSNPLTETYLRWVSTHSTSNFPGIRAVAYMMDRNEWSNFAGDVDGAYAIGGPTLELLAASYNKKHSTQIETYSSLTGNNSGEYGYKTVINEAQGGESVTISDSSYEMWLVNTDYVTIPFSYWIASPWNGGQTTVICLSFTGSLAGNDANNASGGFRPIVVIPRSSLE